MPFAVRALLLAGSLLMLAGPAGAGVPRACVHPQADRLRCAMETRREHLDLLPTQRLRELRQQFERLAAEAPLQDLERNLLLEDIREILLHRPVR